MRRRPELDTVGIALVADDGHRLALTGADFDAAALTMHDRGVERWLIAYRLCSTMAAVDKAVERASKRRARAHALAGAR